MEMVSYLESAHLQLWLTDITFHTGLSMEILQKPPSKQMSLITNQEVCALTASFYRRPCFQLKCSQRRVHVTPAHSPQIFTWQHVRVTQPSSQSFPWHDVYVIHVGEIKWWRSNWLPGMGFWQEKGMRRNLCKNILARDKELQLIWFYVYQGECIAKLLPFS